MPASELQEPEINSIKVCRYAGITYRQLDYWCRNEVVQPTKKAADSGTSRGFDLQETRMVGVLRDLVALGMCDTPLRECAQELRRLLGSNIFGGLLIAQYTGGGKMRGAALSGSVELSLIEDTNEMPTINHPAWVVGVQSIGRCEEAISELDHKEPIPHATVTARKVSGTRELRADHKTQFVQRYMS